MGTLEIRDLGDAGMAYVREHLANVNVFCAALHEMVLAEPGEVFTLAPVGVTGERLRQFRQGGLLSENLGRIGGVSYPDGSMLVPVTSLIKTQTALLRDAMVAAPGAICIVDDYNPRWSEERSTLEPTAFGVGQEVYYLITTEQGEDEFTAAISNSNLIWHGVAAVCGRSVELDAKREAPASEVQLCARAALLITCTAYDGEGFVVWRRIS